MTTLSPTTKSRLQKIPQTNVVWEGDRRPMGSMASHFNGVQGIDERCIIWVDGSEGVVRAMDVVSQDLGLEAVVRTLLRAIESPHHPTLPSRPRKIVVRDREIQFFLRGVLQDLDIKVEYEPQLPLIDRLFEGFSSTAEASPSPIPAEYQAAIELVAKQIWNYAPWKLLTDSDILQVELQDCEIERVYLCVMGMMSAEYGVLIYRSLDSLKRFRLAALNRGKSAAELEQAFLAQDCWFLNYEETEETDLNINGNDEPSMQAFFGSLHPFEGMRHFLDEAETSIVYATLESLRRFCDRHHSDLERSPIAAAKESYEIELPLADPQHKTILTAISTQPELSAELSHMGRANHSNSQSAASENIPVREDLIPDGSLVSLTSIPQELIQQLQHQSKTYCQLRKVSSIIEEIPTIFIQTTRPKARRSISQIQDSGGLRAVCFNPAHDPFSGEVYNLGLLQTEDGELHIFAEYAKDIPQQTKALETWHQRCQKTNGYCALVIAMGASGTNRGNPKAKDMLALFEVRAIDGSDLGMGMLNLMPDFDF